MSNAGPMRTPAPAGVTACVMPLLLPITLARGPPLSTGRTIRNLIEHRGDLIDVDAFLDDTEVVIDDDNNTVVEAKKSAGQNQR